MRIDFDCSGGFANLHLAYHGDTDRMPPSQAEELKNLINSSGVLELRQSDFIAPPPGGAPDMFSYRLSLSTEDTQKTLAFDDATAPRSLQPLLGLLRKLSIEQKLKGTSSP